MNEHQQMEALIKTLHDGNQRPGLLLHACCGPCSTRALECLSAAFNLTILYDNPNIQPQAEYDKRLSALQALLAHWPGQPIGLEISPYQPERFFQIVGELADEPEGGNRCARCFQLRLTQTARLAKAMGYPYIGTTLTTGPRKDAATINRIGRLAAQSVGVSWLPADFKKQNGYQRSIQLSKAYNLYRQDYCGCIYSLRERQQHQTD